MSAIFLSIRTTTVLAMFNSVYALFSAVWAAILRSFESTRSLFHSPSSASSTNIDLEKGVVEIKAEVELEPPVVVIGYSGLERTQMELLLVKVYETSQSTDDVNQEARCEPVEKEQLDEAGNDVFLSTKPQPPRKGSRSLPFFLPSKSFRKKPVPATKNSLPPFIIQKSVPSRSRSSSSSSSSSSLRRSSSVTSPTISATAKRVSFRSVSSPPAKRFSTSLVRSSSAKVLSPSKKSPKRLSKARVVDLESGSTEDAWGGRMSWSTSWTKDLFDKAREDV
ncbi:hypothetical protein C8J56DRAFT_1094764 [Mycena floridula]|nr:hypothetical protein C8J56DRAFT_1094764 [Mycena floridula]